MYRHLHPKIPTVLGLGWILDLGYWMEFFRPALPNPNPKPWVLLDANVCIATTMQAYFLLRLFVSSIVLIAFSIVSFSFI